jgi:hypothetical protein
VLSALIAASYKGSRSAALGGMLFIQTLRAARLRRAGRVTESFAARIAVRRKPSGDKGVSTVFSAIHASPS